MFSISLEFPDEASMRDMADKLWYKHKITGELFLKNVGDVWRLELNAEKEPTAKVVEQLKNLQVSFEIE